MTTIVVLNVNGTMIRVECDGIGRDAVLSKNIVLTGCKELDTEARDGDALDTKLWSVPEGAVLSYAVGKVPPKEPPAAPAPVPVEAPPERVWTEEEKAARRARYDGRDAAVRKRRAARADKAAEVKPAEEPAKPAKPAKRARRRKKPADAAP
jgi:hypothetical protein